MNVRRKFLHALDSHRMVASGDRVVVAVSGGADSMALLHLFLEIRRDRNLEILVAHYHHGLRGREADEDQALVRSQAVRHRLGFFPGTMPPPPPTGSTEEYSRRQRYRFLISVAGRTGARRIAVGHQQDDQAETFLLRLLRGSGSLGLSGIHPVWERLLIRPLLGVSRAEILEYLHASGVPFREDSSNRDRRFVRNRIRHDLLPGLARGFHPEVARTLARTAERLREDDELLEHYTERGLLATRSPSDPRSLRAGRLDRLPGALRRRVLIRFLADLRGSRRRLSSRHIDALLDLLPTRARGKRVSLPGDWRAIRETDRIRFLRGPEDPPRPRFRELLPVPGQCDLPEAGIRIRSRLQARERFVGPLREGGRERAFLDADRVGRQLVVRGRRPGDRFRPFGDCGEQKIKKFFIDRKVPAQARDCWPLITRGDDIVWVVGHQIDHRYRVRRDTRNVLILRHLTGRMPGSAWPDRRGNRAPRHGPAVD